jgi:MFS transporter, AAHS family, 4-hydroxybenzoate transporter
LTASAAPINATTFLDRQRFGRHHWTVLGFSGLIGTVDAFDVYIVAFVLIPIAAAFDVNPAALTPILIAQQAGLMFSTYLLAPLGDRFGRRPLTLACVAGFGLLTLTCSVANSILMLSVIRFLAGLMLGAVISNVTALMFEVSPRARRGLTVTTIGAFPSMSVLIASAVSVALVPRFGWQSVFVVGGLAPLSLLPFLWFYYPESVRFRVARNPADPRIARDLRRFDPSADFGEHPRFTVDDAPVKQPVHALFRDGRLRKTITLWVLYFCVGLLVTVFGSFLPTLLHLNGGLSMEMASKLLGVFALGGACCPLYGLLMDRKGSRVVLIGIYAVATVAIALLGIIDLDLMPLWIAVAVMGGATIPGSVGVLNALGAILYPTPMRVTGLSWASGALRVGGVVAPVLAGVMLAGHWSLIHVFLTLDVFAAIALLAASTLRPTGEETTVPAPSVASPSRRQQFGVVEMLSLAGPAESERSNSITRPIRP